MPSRLIRDGLLDSQRYWNVSIEARQLFIHLMLLADDFGLVSLAPVFVRRRCFDNPPPDSKINKQISDLHDEDLLRVYEDKGAKYAFIPNFGQRMRQLRARNPMPPECLFSDDIAAKTLFLENKHLFKKLSAKRGQVADNSRPEVEVEVKGKEREVEAKGELEPGMGETAAKQPGPQTVRQTPAQQEGPVMQWAEQQGMRRNAGETTYEFRRRVTIAFAKNLGTPASAIHRDSNG